jgi:hypothetical protein
MATRDYMERTPKTDGSHYVKRPPPGQIDQYGKKSSFDKSLTKVINPS